MNQKRFDGKIVLVTGGGSGIGEATALRFAREGAAQVFVLDRLPERAKKVVKEISDAGGIAYPVAVDIGNTAGCDEAIQTVVEKAGGLDIMVSNAATWTQESFLEMKEESWDCVLNVILKASFLLGQRAARAMKDRGGGVILYTASIAASGGVRHFVHYNVGKAGILAMMQTMALELAPMKIRVNAVSPGPSDTQQSVDICGEEAMKEFRKSFGCVPLKRLGSPEDMAAAFTFLASNDAAYITGHNLVVDGGLLADIYTALD